MTLSRISAKNVKGTLIIDPERKKKSFFLKPGL